jgi:predicted nucleotide-binding protein
MEKSKEYKRTRFSVEVLKAAADELSRGLSPPAQPKGLSVQTHDGSWCYDHVDDFYADYRTSDGLFDLSFRRTGYALRVYQFPSPSGFGAHVSVEAPERARINAVFNIFEAHAEASRLPEPVEPAEPVVVFIGHGRSGLWRDLKDHLQDKHGLRVEAYEVGARAGHTVRDILQDMLETSSFAVLVMTGEDTGADGTLRARQNVIHEAGLFQGHLGFKRAIVLVEEGTEEFTNIEGIAQIRFGKGNIKETFGEVLATIRREFPHLP